MALVTCNECGKEISDKALTCPHCGAPRNDSSLQHAQPVMAQTKKGGGLWKWILGVPVALFIIFMILGAIVGNSPEAQERIRDRDKISACWDLQKKKSLDPSAARFAASLCEKMEAEFKLKHNMKP